MISGGALLTALLLQTASAAPGTASEAGATRARLDLRGPADCISRGDLAARVAARSARIRFVDDAAVYAHVVVTSARPGNVVAELVLETAGAEQPPRRFVARSCSEAADAIALIIAVTLDPTSARNGAGTTSTATEPRADVASPPTEKRTEQSPASAPVVAPATLESPTPARPVPPARKQRFGAYVAGQTIVGPAPSVMPGLALYAMAALDGDGLWAPALFLGATHVWRDELSEPGGTASFTLDAASLDACPFRVGRARFVARPCASALVGRLATSGADTEQAASSARPFATAGVAVNASYGTTIELSARLAAGMTLIRDWYDFGGVTFHRAGAITVAASLGAGLRWP
jgi:hypothetical protein